MHPIIKNVLAVIAGIVVGMVINLGLVIVGSFVIPAPEGVDVMDAKSIRDSLHKFGPIHFVFPFLAHALGTLAGAVVAGILAVSRKKWFAIGIGFFFLIGGIANILSIPTPTWFIGFDLLFAYVPMGWLGSLLVGPRHDD